jgi:glucose/arabinose dehydrogenase
LNFRNSLLFITAAASVAACGTPSQSPISATVGPTPQLVQPDHSLIPTVNVASAKGWTGDAHPTPGSGLSVARFADALQHPRWLYVLPNGDVLVAETDAPPKPDDGKGVKGFVMKTLMKKAGSGTPSANRITLLRDADGDGIAEIRTVFLRDINSPFGMALVGNDLYVAATDALLRFHYEPGATSITGPGVRVVELPAGPINHHWTKNVIASRDGSKLYVTVGSNSNVGENGIDNEEGRAAIWEVDAKSGAHRIFASGLRNPNGMAWEPRTGALWTSVNERDELGNDLVPDYMTSVRDGGFYGWPYSYYGQHVDARVKTQRPELVERALVPDYALGAHTASLGLVASEGTSLPDAYRSGMFVGQHGSWNRKPRSGYDVIFVPFADGKPAGAPLPVLTGFVSDDGDANGRPVGVAIDRQGALLVADDVGNSVWRVTGATAQRAAAR